MKTRVITGLVAFIVFIPFLIFAHTAAYTVFAVIVSLIGVLEMVHCRRMMSKLTLCTASLLYAVLTPILSRHLAMGHGFMTMFVLCSALYVFFSVAAAVFSKGKLPFDQVAALVFTVVYIELGFCCLLYLRDVPFGVYLYLLPYLGAWISDIGAYFFGKFFGKTKLIPEVSPNKTVEGALGGILSTLVFMLLYGVFVRVIFKVHVNFFGLLFMGFFLSAVSMVGDLIFSLIKRTYGIKDYSRIMPGHGGILDRFDSVLATAPMTFIVSTVFTAFPLFSKLG